MMEGWRRRQEEGLVQLVGITGGLPPPRTKKEKKHTITHVKPCCCCFTAWNWKEAASRTSEVEIYILRCLLTTWQLKRCAPTLTLLSAKRFSFSFSVRSKFTLPFRQNKGINRRTLSVFFFWFFLPHELSCELQPADL